MGRGTTASVVTVPVAPTEPVQPCGPERSPLGPARVGPAYHSAFVIVRTPAIYTLAASVRTP
ncbi:hypothetical protein EDD96_6619 [Streptomyces sp. Ag109_G2-6]|nr:hypothetical protein EDD96_6619 [Streptomyces sp. Ag109_G2-6]